MPEEKRAGGGLRNARPFEPAKTQMVPWRGAGPRDPALAAGHHPAPSSGRRQWQASDGNLILDDFAHELVLILIEHDGLVVFTGCSHQGILNMVEAVTRAFPGSPLKAVFGGFHLVILPTFNFMAGSREEIRGIGTRMLEYPLECVYTGHCTGSHAFEVLKGAMGKKLEYIATGRTVTV